VTLLLLFTGSGGPKYVDAVASCVGDLTAASEARGSLIPSAVATGVGGVTGNAYQQNQYSTASVPSVGDFGPLLYKTTQLATALVHEVSSFNFLPYESTREGSAAIPATALLGGEAEDRLALDTSGLVYSVGDVAGVATDVASLAPEAVVVAIGLLVATFPARSFGVPSSAGPGRSSAGTVADGGGRVGAGTATIGAGRASTGIVV